MGLEIDIHHVTNLGLVIYRSGMLVMLLTRAGPFLVVLCLLVMPGTPSRTGTEHTFPLTVTGELLD